MQEPHTQGGTLPHDREGLCLTCNNPATFSSAEWETKRIPVVLCGVCVEELLAGRISYRELRLIYVIRSQIGHLFEEISVLHAKVSALTRS